MEAPEKIWMTDEWVRQFDDKDFMGEDSVEYVRKDAFIEEAVGRLKHYLDNGMWIANDVCYREKEAIVEDFKNYLKYGEVQD